MAEATQVTISHDPQVGQPTLEQSAAALEAAKTAPVVDPNRPSWLPQKFKTPEDMAKSYAELESAFAKRATPAAAEPPKAEPAAPPPAVDPLKIADAPAEQQTQAAQDAVSQAGFDVAPYTKEFETSGDLSADSRGKIAEALKGQFGDAAAAMVDTYVDGHKARVASMRSDAFKEAGGEDNFKAMSEWAAAGLPQASKDAFNRAVSSGDQATVAMAIRGLRATFEAAVGRPGKLISGDTRGAAESAAGFRSIAEQNAAFNDPRYRSDPAYRADVARRMMAPR